jgi:NADPH-dependent curcumin reductase CurA
VFDQLYRFKVSRGIPTWDQALENVLAGSNSGKNVTKADA